MEYKKYKKCLWTLLAIVCGLLFTAICLTIGSNRQSEKQKTIASAKTVPSDATLSQNEPTHSKWENQSETHMVIPCGYPIGVYVKTEGVMVIDTGCFLAKDSSMQSPCENILKQGDYITSINGVKVQDKHDLIEMVSSCEGHVLEVGIIRDLVPMKVKIVPKQNENGTYMLGLWVKDDISGIGTLTYVDENGFGALGHSINDNDTGEIFHISDGAIYDAKLLRIVKADGKQAGRLEGVIDYKKECMLGRVETNESLGIKGYLTENGKSRLLAGNWMEIAKREEVHEGEAQLLSWVSGNAEYYDIKIVDVFSNKASSNEKDGMSKSIEIQITDQNLLDLTSGIVQGLSGTPIIQDGKLVGAVTHVFLKDSTKGYGVFAEDMIYN
ncbi:MAG: SpoIVB peptidase S55 domain-containing protein [Eubacteriales bacterium]|nr:SpoIVB peptidase S55 domain-containing protein [Lachnospiraceae bacterium]MDO5126538.1 SpoIVB peptidase S55 domain-containing protein [Eubacteriales bacterium]